MLTSNSIVFIYAYPKEESIYKVIYKDGKAKEITELEAMELQSKGAMVFRRYGVKYE